MNIPNEVEWLAALKRCVRDDVRSRLEVIALGLPIGSHLGQTGAQVLEFVDTVLQSLEGYDYDILSEGTYRRALQGFGDLSADEQLILPSKTVLTRQLTEMLAKCGDELTLDEISGISEALVTNGEENARSATEESLRGYVKELDEKLSEITSPSELDDYENKLLSMLGEHGIELTYQGRRAIERHREHLDEEYSRSDSEYSPSPQLRRDSDATDAEIRSLFSTLDLG
jgi:hypothetical protein